jgi:hypothetical protein
MSEPAGISWVELLTLMVHGPDPSVRGVLHSFEGRRPAQGIGWVAMAGDPLPVFAGTGIPEEDDENVGTGCGSGGQAGGCGSASWTESPTSS